MKKLLFCTLFLFSFFIIYSQEYKITNWLNDKSSATVLTFDDWSPGHGSIVVPALIEKKLTGTFFVIANNSSLGGGYPVMINAVNHGIEIGNHTMSHPDLTTSSSHETEINGAKATLESHIPGFKISTFAYPLGTANNVVKNKVMEKHIGARGVSPSGTWSYDLASYYQLGTIAVSSSLSEATFTNHVKKAIQDGGLITFMFHSVYNNSVSDNWYSAIDESLLLQYLDSLKIYESRTWVTTMSDAIKYHAEKKAAILSTLNQSSSLWTLKLSDNLPDSIYNHPLTIKLKIAEGKQVKNILQGVDSLAYYMKGDSIVFNAIPDKEDISIALEDYNAVNPLNPFIHKVSIFPNPSSGTFTLSANSNKDFFATIIVYDMTGKEALRLNMVNFQKGENLIPVNILNLADGNYLVNISGNGFSESYSVMKK